MDQVLYNLKGELERKTNDLLICQNILLESFGYEGTYDLYATLKTLSYDENFSKVLQELKKDQNLSDIETDDESDLNSNDDMDVEEFNDVQNEENLKRIRHEELMKKLYSVGRNLENDFFKVNERTRTIINSQVDDFFKRTGVGVVYPHTLARIFYRIRNLNVRYSSNEEVFNSTCHNSQFTLTNYETVPMVKIHDYLDDDSLNLLRNANEILKFSKMKMVK